MASLFDGLIFDAVYGHMAISIGYRVMAFIHCKVNKNNMGHWI